MYHTTLFENFPDKFHIYSISNNEYKICGKHIHSIYDFMKNNSLYKGVIKENVDKEGEIYVVKFKYNDGEIEDYLETNAFDEERLKKEFPYVISVNYVERHLPFTSNSDCGDYYVISIPEHEDFEDIKTYVFEHFGYILISECLINNKRVLSFRSHESYYN